MTDVTVPSVSAIADVLALWGLDGSLTPPLRPVVAAPRAIAGEIVTITMYAGTSGPGMASIYDVLSNDLSGRFLIIAGATEVPGAIWGEILSKAALQQGALGVLVEGWVRDRGDVESLGLPMYACGERVAGPNAQAHISAIGATVQVHGVSVAADDHLVVDANGCVRIPAGRRDEVLDGARRYEAAEFLVGQALDAGEPLSSAYRHKKSMVDELRK